MALRKNATEKSVAAMAKAHATVAYWQERVAEIDRQLAGLTHNVGDAVLDAEDTGVHATAVAGRIAGLRGDLDVARSTLTAAHARQDAAASAVKRAEAAELRGQARTLRSDAEARQKRTDGLLAQLVEHENVAYVPKPTDRAADGTPLEPPIVPLTATERMRGEADVLGGRAIVLEGEADGEPVAVPVSIGTGGPDHAALARQERGQAHTAA